VLFPEVPPSTKYQPDGTVVFAVPELARLSKSCVSAVPKVVMLMVLCTDSKSSGAATSLENEIDDASFCEAKGLIDPNEKSSAATPHNVAEEIKTRRLTATNIAILELETLKRFFFIEDSHLNSFRTLS
jgi:hypothetical protein